MRLVCIKCLPVCSYWTHLAPSARGTRGCDNTLSLVSRRNYRAHLSTGGKGRYVVRPDFVLPDNVPSVKYAGPFSSKMYFYERVILRNTRNRFDILATVFSKYFNSSTKNRTCIHGLVPLRLLKPARRGNDAELIATPLHPVTHHHHRSDNKSPIVF